MEQRGSKASANRAITLVATHAIDRIPLGSDGIREAPGGPAHYVGRALSRLGRPYHLITGEVAMVDVVPTPHGEQYIIAPLPAIPLPPCLTGAATILSPIIGEIDPDSVPPVEGLLALDLQGFVREPRRSTAQVERRFHLANLLDRADVVKASESELKRLDDASLRALDDCILVVTRGVRGASVRCGDEEAVIRARPVEVDNTIGAGDSFLAAFVCSLLDGASLQQAGDAAARFTEHMLEERR